MNRKIIKIFLPTLMILFIISNVLYAREVFEKGDALYRMGDWPGSSILGHAGLYQSWEDEGEDADPDNLTKHLVVESQSRSGVTGNNFSNFLTGLPFWSVRTDESLTYKQRQIVVNTASAQIGCRYNFFWGYKAPGRSFRCDGLVEYCYEQANAGIVPYDTWVTLTPMLQKEFLTVRTEAEVEEVEIRGIEIDNHPAERDEEGRYCLAGEVFIDADASDGKNGSGLERIEIWVGYPDDTPHGLPGKRVIQSQQNYPKGCRYYLDWDTSTVDDGEYTLYAKAFDQAGNTKVSDPVEVIVDNEVEELDLVLVGHWDLNSAIGGNFVYGGYVSFGCRGIVWGNARTGNRLYQGYAYLYRVDIPADSNINNVVIVLRHSGNQYSSSVYKSIIYQYDDSGWPPNIAAEVKIDYSFNSHPNLSTPIGEYNLVHKVIGGYVHHSSEEFHWRYIQSFLPGGTFIKTIPVGNSEIESVWISIYPSNLQSMAAQIPWPPLPDPDENYGWQIWVAANFAVDSIYSN